MSEKRQDSPEKRPSTGTPETKESPHESTVGHLVALVKCKVMGVCETAEAKKRTDELRKSVEKPRQTLSKVDLSPLGESVPKIGRTGTARKMLFGNGTEILKTHGTFYSDKDEALFSKCRAMSAAESAKSPFCSKLANKESDAIRLKGTVEVNFPKNLKEMWEEKIARYGKTNPDIQKFYDARVRPIVEGRVKLQPSSRAAFETEVRTAIESVRKSANFDEGLRKYGIDPSSQKGKLGKVLLKSIGPNDLIGIGLTELMDSKNGAFNLRMLDTVLSMAGEEYFGLVPALADPYVSYGPYQHTKMSVGKDGGATIADDRFCKGANLKTRDIMTMPIADQHAAAYLLAWHNVAMMLRDLDVATVVTKGPKNKKISKTYDLADAYAKLVAKGDSKAMGAFYQYL
ncbi:MAG: hypothetical protein QMC36_02425 [Patescibacteria group bacterium]